MVNLLVFTRVSYIHSWFAGFFSNEQPAFPSTSSTFDLRLRANSYAEHADRGIINMFPVGKLRRY